MSKSKPVKPSSSKNAYNKASYRRRWLEVIVNRTIRVGEEEKVAVHITNHATRNQFQRDFDRIVFSSSFKRLQNKTQVFPLPGTAQVHNRFTHSLEVASVGRSLGSIVGNEIADALERDGFGDSEGDNESINFYRYELKDLILAGCLAHDMGNPCFGHSGEEILSDYFKELQHKVKKRDPSITRLLPKLKKISEPEWKDLKHFEGNANTLRMLTTHYHGKLPGGLRLTYLTLASIMKYPWGSSVLDSDHPICRTWEHKYGFFLEQQDLVKKIADTLKLLPYNKSLRDKPGGGNPPAYCRHPFVYLVEAADDICYLIMDMEDAHKIGILSVEEVMTRFYSLIKELHDSKLVKTINLSEVQERKKAISDVKEQIVYLRSKAINALTEAVAKVYIDQEEKILVGTPKGIVKDLLTEEYHIKCLKEIIVFSKEKIYEHRSVSETMIAASKILPWLLDLFLPALLLLNKENYQSEKNFSIKKAFNIIDEQFTGSKSEYFKQLNPYARILVLLDYITGMTDEYIFELYRKLMGIERNPH